MRVQGRKSCLVQQNSQQQQQMANYATLPRGRIDERKLSNSISIDSTGSQKQPQIISYDEKTVMLKRNSNKGSFGFVLRGAKANPAPPTADQPSTSKEINSNDQNQNSLVNGNKENLRNQQNSPPQCFRPISLQYFEEIEIGGVAHQVCV